MKKGFFDEKYPKDRLNFVTFMLFAFPVSAIVMFFTWLVLCYKWLPKRYWFTLASRKTTRVGSNDEQEKTTDDTLAKHNQPLT